MPLHTNVIMLCGILLTGSATAFAQQQQSQQSDFTGVWRMDTTKFAKRDALLAALTLTVVQRSDSISIITDVADTGRAPMQMRARYVPTPSAVTSATSSSRDPRVSVGSFDWRGDTLVLHLIEHRPDRTLEIEERWTLDSTGQTLSRYQRVLDGKRRSQQTLLFTRQ